MNDLRPLLNNPAGRLMAQFFDLYNRGDAQGIREFVAAYYADPNAYKGTDEDRAVWSSQDYTTALVKAIEYDSGVGLQLHSIEANEPTQAAVLAQGGLAGEWLYLKMATHPDAPDKLYEFRTRPAAMLPGKQLEGQIKIDQMIGELDRMMGRLTAADIFAGAIVIAKDGVRLYERAFGLANRDHGVANHLNTKFNIGSGSKMFTAVAIAHLVEQGKLRFEDTLAQHLPDYPNPAAQEITIHQLLTHLSGIGSYWNQRFEAQRTGIRNVNDFMELFMHEPLLAQPAQRWLYSNGGYVILGAIIERITGRSYYDVVQDLICDRAGMQSTGAYEVDRPIPELAIGYTDVDYSGNRDLSGVRSNLFMHVVRGGPAGGAFSTVEDLLRFGDALRNHALLSPTMSNEVLTGKVKLKGGDLQYAYGFWDRRVNSQRFVGHPATFPGIGGQFDMLLDSGYTVAILSNADPSAAQVVIDPLRHMLTHL